jgi:hypothetical protein
VSREVDPTEPTTGIDELACMAQEPHQPLGSDKEFTHAAKDADAGVLEYEEQNRQIGHIQGWPWLNSTKEVPAGNGSLTYEQHFSLNSARNDPKAGETGVQGGRPHES